MASHIPVSSLPEHLGGSSQYSHMAWIQSCVNSTLNNSTDGSTDCLDGLLHSYCQDQNQTANANPGATMLGNSLDDGNANPQNHRHTHWNGVTPLGSNANIANGRQAPPPQSDTPPDTPLHHKHNSEIPSVPNVDADDCRRDGNGAEQEPEFLVEDAEGRDGVPPLPQKSSRPTPVARSPVHETSWSFGMASVHTSEPGGMTVQELVQHVKTKKKKGIYQEYEEIRKEPPAGSFDYSK